MTQSSSKMRASVLYSEKCNSASKRTLWPREDVPSRCVVSPNSTAKRFAFLACAHSKVGVSSLLLSNSDCLQSIHFQFEPEYHSERRKAQSNERQWLGIASLFFFIPPSQSDFNLLSCIFILRLRNAVWRRVSLCQGPRGRKGSSSRGMKWAQTNASKWFLSLGQTPPRPLRSRKMSTAGPPKWPVLHRVRQSDTSAGSFHSASSQKLSNLSGGEGHPVPPLSLNLVSMMSSLLKK